MKMTPDFIHKFAKYFLKKKKTELKQPVAGSGSHVGVSKSSGISAKGRATPDQPYFIQIGFDFGTCYSKCVCRDVMTDKAWVYRSPSPQNSTFPFLIPGTLILKSGQLTTVKDVGVQYVENGLYHLKPALVNAAQGKWNDPVFESYRLACGSRDPERLRNFLESCAIYFLAASLGAIRADIRRQMPDFGRMKDDYMAVNLAVPVADNKQKAVNELYERLLLEAWHLADRVSGNDSILLVDLEAMRKEHQGSINHQNDSCYIYPEVSASVQAFVRSRVSSPGIYLFSDTGAGTVDQSVFIFIRRNGKEYLTFLHGSVLPLGSSHIEHLAAKKSGNTTWESLEQWRIRKEQNSDRVELRSARHEVAKDLNKCTTTTLARSKKKLYLQDQIEEIRVIFGGGGHCEDPYRKGALKPFAGHLFRKNFVPDVIGVPIPKDLELRGSESDWMRRLTVAYGLSFEHGILVDYAYPEEVETPDPKELCCQKRKIPDAPSKDEC